nr:ribonuclease H-like domain-containing protein [Tanacetum cinerariifolium]
MVTRSHIRTIRPNLRYAGHVSTISPLLWSYKEAFNDPNWRNAMFDKYNALIKNKSWTSVPRPEGANIVRCMWLFRLKFLADGTLSQYKARLVANGSTQLYVKNAFLHGNLAEIVYMHQPPGFQDPGHPNHVCLLQRSLYGLKQAPRAWFQRFAAYITTVGFTPSRCDSFLFIYKHDNDTSFLLLYVDNIVLTASSDRLLQQIRASLHREFSMIDLGALNYFLGISVMRDSSGMFLSQCKYAMEILERAHMVGCNPSRTPIDIESKLGDGGTPVVDPTLYQSLAADFADADWAGCPTTRWSTSWYCVFLGTNLLSWSSKHQLTLSHSSVEAEYRGVANAVAEICWIRNLLCVILFGIWLLLGRFAFYMFFLGFTSELKKEFSHLDTLYPDYFKSPSGEDWNIVDNLCTYLKLIFDTATVVMDPRFKMQLVDFSFAKIFGDEVASYINIVDEGIHQLFLDYAAGDVTGHLSNRDGHGLGLTDFNDFVMKSACQQSKSELDRYLEESLLPRSHEFDVMRWWKLNEPKYPTLSKMARDILTLHVSTVDPESVFDAGVKEMDRYRCTLKPETVEALYYA